jgi:hypothetical protein
MQVENVKTLLGCFPVQQKGEDRKNPTSPRKEEAGTGIPATLN